MYLLGEVLVRCILLHAAFGQCALKDLIAVDLLFYSPAANQPIDLQNNFI